MKMKRFTKGIIFLSMLLFSGCISLKELKDIKTGSIEIYDNKVDLKKNWKSNIGGTNEFYLIQPSPVLDDVNYDGILEVIAGNSKGFVFCMNGEDGNPIWSFKASDAISSTPTVGDAMGVGGKEILIGSLDENLYCLLGEKRKLVWTYQADGTIISKPLPLKIMQISTNARYPIQASLSK